MLKQQSLVAAFFVGWVMAQGAAVAGERPLPVAPGGPNGETAVSRPCPTFHWSVSTATDDTGYELAVYRIAGDGEEGPAPAAERVLHHSLPAGAAGWTLPPDRCLEPGGRYAWSVRAVGSGLKGDWSEPSLFEISAAPSLAEVKEALEVLRWFELKNGRSRTRNGESGVAVAMNDPTVSAERPRSRRELAELRRRSAGPNATAGAHREAAQGGTSAAPTASTSPSLSVDGQIHLNSAGDVFRDGVPFLWTDGTVSSLSGSLALGLHALKFESGSRDNTAVGHAALVANTTGYFNSAFGQTALYYNTTGSKNSAFGQAALDSNSTGSRNSAFGQAALYSNTTGYSNSAFGQHALRANTNGYDNSAFGQDALRANTIGWDNSAFGQDALQVNTTGYYNSAFGQDALSQNTTGSLNSAFGHSALRANTTGGLNTAFGEYALRRNTTGSRNSAFGQEALRLNTMGLGNSAFGHEALQNNTTGSDNTAVGDRALVNGTTGSNNIAIGREAGASVAAAASNNILIGNDGTGVVSGSPEIRIGMQGTQGHTRIAGIAGVSLSGAASVVVQMDGRLGVSASSRRFKEDVRDMGEVADKLGKLRPVRFHFKQTNSDSGERPPEYGLIAEEVAEALPELVALDPEGRPYAVRYDLLSVLLLNELQRQQRENRRIDLAQARLLAAQRRDIEALEKTLAAVQPASKGRGARKR